MASSEKERAQDIRDAAVALSPAPSTLRQLQPGHILAVRTGGMPAWWIRLSAALRNEPNLANHIAVFHHWDAKGVPWCIEGRPGGVGWEDARKYLQSPYTITNARQPLSGAQSAGIAETVKLLLRDDYDWTAIIDDGLKTFGLDIPGWDPSFSEHGVLTAPAHVDCSALADYAYMKNRAACPTGGRTVTPDDWVEWLMQRGWESMAKGLL